MAKRKKTKSKSYNFFTFTNILLILNVVLLAIVSFYFLENQSLKEQNNIYKQKISQIQKEKKYIQKKKQIADLKHMYEEKTRALNIDYTSHIDTTTYIQSKKVKKEEFNYKDIVDNTKKTIEKKVEDIKKIIKQKKRKIYIKQTKISNNNR